MAKPWARRIYNSKRWQMARAEALRRDRYTCQSCQGRAEEVHHIIELAPNNIHNDSIVFGLDNLESLCWRCHQAETHDRTDIADGYVFDDQGQPVPR